MSEIQAKVLECLMVSVSSFDLWHLMDGNWNTCEY